MFNFPYDMRTSEEKANDEHFEMWQEQRCQYACALCDSFDERQRRDEQTYIDSRGKETI